MKIVEVIVDELPIDCTKCGLANWDGLDCAVTHKNILQHLTNKTKPDWCPLITKR